MKEKYITDDEREKCRKVADAFAELYEIENILVVDAGRYGFVKLQYYRPPQGFEDAITFTDSRSMFENLWEEWFDTQLFLLAKGTPMACSCFFCAFGHDVQKREGEIYRWNQ